MKKNSSLFLVLFILMIITFSCNRSEVFFEYQKIPSSEWKQDYSVKIQYEFNDTTELNDTTQKYDYYIHIRYNSQYPYQNLWLLLEEKVDNKIVKTDTVELFLADANGKWIGKGIGAIREITLPYKQNVTIKNPQIGAFIINHRMRTEKLKGIREIGLRIEKQENGKK